MSLNVCNSIKTNRSLLNYLSNIRGFGECKEAYIDEEKQLLLYKNTRGVGYKIQINCIDDETGNRLPVCTLDNTYVLQFNPYDYEGGKKNKRRKTIRRRKTVQRRKTAQRRKTNRR